MAYEILCRNERMVSGGSYGLLPPENFTAVCFADERVAEDGWRICTTLW